MWSKPSLNSWWLTNESDRPSVSGAIRSFIEDRSAKQSTHSTEEFSGVRILMSKLSVHESSAV